MARKNTAGKAAGQAAALPAATPGATAEQLRTTITDMDALSQEGFRRIDAIARITLLAMESPEAYRHPELIAQALQTIAGMAQRVQECITFNAEDVGCSWDEDDMERRRAACTAAVLEPVRGAA